MIKWSYGDFDTGKIYDMRQGFAITSSEIREVYVPISMRLEKWLDDYQVFLLTDDMTSIGVEEIL